MVLLLKLNILILLLMEHAQFHLDLLKLPDIKAYLSLVVLLYKQLFKEDQLVLLLMLKEVGNFMNQVFYLTVVEF